MTRCILIASLQLALRATIALADGGVVVDHQPNNSSGNASDSSITDPYTGEQIWQFEADQFSLFAPATVRRVTFWGFYWLDNPPAEETFRFRVYDARPGDGLPGAVVHERSAHNVPRTATGNRIPGDLVSAFEYRFTVDLDIAIQLQSNVPYWFEVAQIGDVLTAFRWETSSSPLDGRAFMNTFLPQWQPAVGPDLAFQLATVPEPATLVLIVSGASAWARACRNSRQTNQIQLSASDTENCT